VTPHILFVDDEAPIREMLSLYFRKKGFTVTAAVTGQEAMELVDRVAFHLAILDVNLAGENGLALLGFMHSNHPELPVIMFTGYESDPDLLEKALSAGASGFMRKSESLDSLFAEVRKHLPANAMP
jgi:DNA-binding NtrC family response regulator